jgi:hypothetical protein
VHHLDVAQWGCPEVTTEPFELSGQGVFPKGGMTDTCIAWDLEYKYASGLRMLFQSSAEGATVGCRFEGDEGWVFVSRAGIWAEPQTLLDVPFKPGDVQLHRSPVIKNDYTNMYTSPYVNHTADFFRSLRTREDPVSTVESGFRATTLGNVGEIAVHLGREVRWDWKSEQFVNDSDANAMLSRPMRSPWTL